MTASTPLISAIVAMADNRVIGHHNQLPWHLPADLKHFKALTTGHPIIMGRSTYESIGKPLPQRTNIIMTRDPSLQIPGCLVAHSVQEALKEVQAMKASECFIIGGAAIFQAWLPNIQQIYLTVIHHSFPGDTYFPLLDLTEWTEESREDHEQDAANAFKYSFITLKRKHYLQST